MIDGHPQRSCCAFSQKQRNSIFKGLPLRQCFLLLKVFQKAIYYPSQAHAVGNQPHYLTVFNGFIWSKWPHPIPDEAGITINPCFQRADITACLDSLLPVRMDDCLVVFHSVNRMSVYRTSVVLAGKYDLLGGILLFAHYHSPPSDLALIASSISALANIGLRVPILNWRILRPRTQRRIVSGDDCMYSAVS